MRFASGGDMSIKRWIAARAKTAVTVDDGGVILCTYVDMTGFPAGRFWRDLDLAIGLLYT